MWEGEKNNQKQIKQTNNKPWVLNCSQLLVSVVGQGEDAMPPPDQKKKLRTKQWNLNLMLEAPRTTSTVF